VVPHFLCWWSVRGGLRGPCVRERKAMIGEILMAAAMVLCACLCLYNCVGTFMDACRESANQNGHEL